MVDKEQLAEMMGEKNIVRPAQQQYPIIRLQGNKGVFMRLDIGADGKYEKPKEIGQVVEGEIIAVRRQLSEFTKQYTRSSNEFDELTDEIIVWERANGTKAQQVFKGHYQDARKKFQGIRSRYQLYTIIGGELVKVVIKGSGLGNLFEYFHELKDARLHIIEVKTRIEPAQETGELGSYYATTFTNAGAVSEEHLGEVAVKLQAFHETLKEIRATYQKKAAEPSLDDLPIVDLDESQESDESPF
jgi:hypothetical protein